MTSLPPTSDVPDVPGAVPAHPFESVQAPPAGLPDVETMNRWAAQLWSQLPGEAGAASPELPQLTEVVDLPTLPSMPAPAGMPEPPGGLSTRSPHFYFLESLGQGPAFGAPDLSAPASTPTGAAPAGGAPARAPAGGAPAAAPAQTTAAPPDPSLPHSGIDDRPSRSATGSYGSYGTPGIPEGSSLGGIQPTGFDLATVRSDFPILSERVGGRRLVWFDNAATTQKPQVVIDRLAYFYAHENSNIHRAAHTLAARATDAFEESRRKVAGLLGAESPDTIVFVRGATEAVNLVAHAWGKANLGEGDEIVISHLEHHANIVPWQMVARETGAVIKVIPVDDTGQVILSEYHRLLGPRTKLVAVTHVSNALGTVTPVEELVDGAHRVGARILVDGAQSVPHLWVEMQHLRPDFYLFSGHKIYGPTGIGALYGTPEVLESMPPWQGGGNMITHVTLEHSDYQHPPGRFEAGTGNIADAVGLGAAIDYVQRVGIEAIASYEHALLDYATPRVAAVPGVRLVGTAAHKASVLSFVMDGYTPEQVGRALNEDGIAVRAGHHCAQPILRRFGLEATVRPSFAFYNTCEEIDLMVSVLHRLAGDAGRGTHGWHWGAPPSV